MQLNIPGHDRCGSMGPGGDQTSPPCISLHTTCRAILLSPETKVILLCDLLLIHLLDSRFFGISVLMGLLPMLAYSFVTFQ